MMSVASSIELGNIIKNFEYEKQCVSALRMVGENINPSFLSFRRKFFLYQIMILSINALLNFQAICPSCNKFVFFQKHLVECSYQQCPIHHVYKCPSCINHYDMTEAPEDIDYLIMHTRRRFFTE